MIRNIQNAKIPEVSAQILLNSATEVSGADPAEVLDMLVLWQKGHGYLIVSVNEGWRRKTYASLKPFQNGLVLFLGIGTVAISLGFLFAINMLLQRLLFRTDQENEMLILCLASRFEPV